MITPLPELGFTSFLQYSPSGQSDHCSKSRRVCYAIKNDGSVNVRQADGEIRVKNAIDHFAEKIANHIAEYEVLSRLFDADAVLIPIPRNAPLARKDALWPAKRICDSLVSVGLAQAVIPALNRTATVQKAAHTKRGTPRTSPSGHFQSTALEDDDLLLEAGHIILVDDVITRGSTFIGMEQHIRRVAPQARIDCFAMVRTMSNTVIDRIAAPVSGTIHFYGGNSLSRVP